MASASVASLLYAESDVTGQLVVAGHGPERVLIERLARAFEKANPGAAVTISWDRTLKAIEMVRSGKAHIAVTGEEDANLTSIPIARDGIAVIVNFSNPVKEVTTQQLGNLFSGNIRMWSDLDEHATEKVEVIRRPDDRNITASFEHSLDIRGKMSDTAESIRSDQKVLSRVSGRLGAIGYLSLEAALEAVKFGTPVRILLVDGVEPAEPTVKDGRYRLRRPVLLLTSKKPKPLVAAFIEYALSPTGQKIVDDIFIPYSP